MVEKKGKIMTIYDIPVLVGKVFPRAITPVNIEAGFRVSGLSPLDLNTCTDDEFLPSDVMDRPPSPQEDGTKSVPATTKAVPIQDEEIEPGPSNAKDESLLLSSVTLNSPNSTSKSIESTNTILTPEDINPVKKAEPRKRTCGRYSADKDTN